MFYLAVTIVFFIILGVLIFVHELGHFIIARRNGIRAYEFGFGFPPRIFGVQFISGKKKEKVREIESIAIERTDIKMGKEEIIRETVTEKIHDSVKKMPVGRWRVIWGRHDGDDENEEADWEEIDKNKYERSTIYSFNWIPLGGFVKIKGEDGGHKNEPDSFSGKSAWTRTKVLAAGVIMNFLLAWVLFSTGYVVGSPEAVDNGDMITIAEVASNSPAADMGLKGGDEILKNQITPEGVPVNFSDIKNVQDYINSYKGQEVTLKIKRGNEFLSLKGTPRVNAPENQGSLGIVLAEVSIVKYPLFKAVWLGFLKTWGVLVLIISVLLSVIKDLFTHTKVTGLEVGGPVKIFGLTGDYVRLGYIYVIQFAALLSVNLGLINILPIPALDGGRIFFVILEKIKGKPVSQKVEQAFHTAFFFLFIMLMLFITLREIPGLFKQ